MSTPSVANTSSNFVEELRGFDSFGAATADEQVGDVRYLTNEFWTSKQRQGHRLHEVSYRACFKPQLPGFFIDRLTTPGDRVYDPFMGRGTTLIEASLKGRMPVGNDINPLSQALVEPRLNPPKLEELLERLDSIPWDSFETFLNEDLLVFYHPGTLAQIEGLREWLKNKKLSLIDQWIRMVAVNRLTGHSPGFFSVYTLPPNQAVSLERQKKINRDRNQTPPERNVKAIIAKKSKALLAHGGLATPHYELHTRPSDQTEEVEANSISLTVTSPPFLDVVDYEGDNWLRGWFLGVDPKSVVISNHRKVEAWRAFVHSTLKELARITKQGGHIAFEVGEVRGGKIRLETEVIKAAEGLPLDVLCVMINQQDFTKTSNCWGVGNNTKGTNTNRIVVLRKNEK